MNAFIISHAFLKSEQGLSLHPDLLPWQKQLDRCKQQWFSCEDKTPLSWLALMLDVNPAALLASKLESNEDSKPQQYWVASPYHAQLARDHYRVLPDGVLPWCEEDAWWMSELINPLLKDDDMELKPVGAALLLLCQQPLDVSPMPFAQVSGSLLPNRHPDGADGGRLMRLLSEIQMTLHQHPAEHRRNKGEPDIHGLWLWGSANHYKTKTVENAVIATRSPFLQSIVDGQNAKMMLTDVENLAELAQQNTPLAKNIVLSGEGHAVLLTKSIFPKFGTTKWQPKAIKSEVSLLSRLRDSGDFCV